MMIEVAFDSVRTISVENGRRSRVNLQNVGAVAAQNIAARIAKRMLGFSTVTGARLRSSNNSLAIQPTSSYYTSFQSISSAFSGIERSLAFWGLDCLRASWALVSSHSLGCHTGALRYDIWF